MARPGTFPPGVSGNPGGKPKGYGEFMAACREHTEAAVAVLVKCLKSENEKIQIDAAQALLDRGWGKAPQAMSGEGGEGPAELLIRWKKDEKKSAHQS